jgi:hypothetical protein
MLKTPPIALAWILTCFVALPGCAGDDEPAADLTVAPAASTSGAPESESTSTGAVDPTSTGTTSDSTGTTFDTTSGTTSGGSAEAVPCTAIDVLFVVDDSSTMAEEQVRLSAAAPGFIAAMRAKLPDVAVVHVGVIATDSPALSVSAGKCGPFVSGLGFMTQDDDLSASLVCAAQVGVAGSPDERPMEMLLAAVDDLANEPGGLNSDFVRKPALLVAVILTDEEDDHEVDPAWGSEGDPADWFAGLTAIKDGHAQDIVVLTLAGMAAPNACPPFQWDGKTGAEPAPRLAEFTAMFPFASVGDACAPSYDAFLLDAVPVVADACASFIPVE